MTASNMTTDYKSQYFQLLAEKFDSEEKVATEIINLESILELPKGTEHFVSDLHGEFQSFQHVLRNGSGNVKVKIDDIFKDRLTDDELSELAALVYYPKEKLTLIKNQFTDKEELAAWYKSKIEQLIELVAHSSSKYTRSKLRKALPPQFAYIIEELLYKKDEHDNKKRYYDRILNEIIELGQANKLITGLSFTIQRLVVDHLHVVGDIYDRGPEPDKIMDTLIDYHSVDIQWGNHDVLWLGAYAGSKVCLANIIRICARYNNLDIIEDAYGINLRPLFTLADKYYDDNPAFHPKKTSGKPLTEDEQLQMTKVQQAISMIQFKLESPIIKRRPSFDMDDRLVLENINYDTMEYTVGDKTYPLENTCFSTVNRNNPSQLTDEEADVMNTLLISVQQSEKLKRHMNFMMKKGSLYLRYNGNLLIHGCIPVTENCDMEGMEINGEMYYGRELLDQFEIYLRHAFTHLDDTEDLATDLIWYLWTGKKSSLFGKRAMTTFERYFISDKATHKEEKNPYYSLREKPEMAQKFLKEFDLDPEHGHIVNGHTPVKEKEGENPIKADGKLIVIDGGFSKAYQSTTGIAGYTLLFNSYGMQLVAHQEFNSKDKVLENESDVLAVRRIVDEELERKKVRDTEIGKRLRYEIDMLKTLMKHRYLN